MEAKDLVIPGLTIIFAAGTAFASFESAAQDVEDVEGVEQRLDKMEDIVQKMLDIQQKQAVNVAQICQATNANCSN